MEQLTLHLRTWWLLQDIKHIMNNGRTMATVEGATCPTPHSRWGALSTDQPPAVCRRQGGGHRPTGLGHQGTGGRAGGRHPPLRPTGGGQTDETTNDASLPEPTAVDKRAHPNTAAT